MTVRAPAPVEAILRRTAARLQAAGVATARHDAERLLARVLGTTRLGLLLEPRRDVSPPALVRLEALVLRRARHEPLQYLLGEAEFCGLTLAVGPGVFIPRPETELLVERALRRCPAGPGVVVELCTGSGAVACALALARPELQVWAVERSPAAAAWARRNVARHGLDGRVHVVEGDLVAPLQGRGLERRCSLVVANPPYIPSPALAGLPREVRAYEPVEALDGGLDGLAVVRRIVAAAPTLLRPGGVLLLEIGHDQAERLRRLLAADGRYGAPVFTRDLLGYERVLEAPVVERPSCPAGS